MENKIEFSPEKNSDVISIIKQKDGNYIGYMQKFGKVVKARQADPQVVLQLLLTHNGDEDEKMGR